ncbi:MAG: putative porin [Limisphaerales bacterium]
MRHTSLTTTLLAVLATASLTTTALAQTSDPVLDLLVKKGVLTKEEADNARKESDKNFTKAFSAKTGMPDWVKSVKLNGDLRLRLESIQNWGASSPDRNRYRYRVRFGPTFAMADDWEVGILLTSSDPDATDVGTLGQGGDPISQNASFKDNGTKKFVFFDKVYTKWSGLRGADWQGTLTLGKMENPFHFPSTMLFDKDYTPEGVAQDFLYRFSKDQSARLTLAGFSLEEVPTSSTDPVLLAAQLRWDAKWSPQWSTTLGFAALSIQGTKGLNTANVPNIGQGNTRSATGALGVNFNDVYVDAGATWRQREVAFYPGEFPITVSADYLRNLSARLESTGFSAGIQLGKAARKGQWELNYRWTELRGDAWYEEVAESDFGAFYSAAPVGGAAGYRSGTNVRGHWLKGTYALLDSLAFSVAYFYTSLINDPVPRTVDSTTGRLFVEAVWKF